MRRIRPLYKGSGAQLPDITPENVPEPISFQKVKEFAGANAHNEKTVTKIIKQAIKKSQPKYIDTKYLLEPKRVPRG